MVEELNEEQIKKGRAIIEAHLSGEDLEKMKELLSEDAPAFLSPEQKAAIRTLFQSLGYLQ